MDSIAPLVNVYRGEIHDLTHYGHLAIVDENSRVVFGVGNPDEIVFYRSASKPFQALPAIKRGLDKKYGLTDEESVILAGSHAGEPFHIDALESILLKSGLSEDTLIMKPAVPLDTKTNEERLSKGLPLRKLYHNCSGKHAALMLIQRELGGKTEDYWKLDSPAQREVIQTIKILSETERVETGVDGCGVPVFAVGVRHIANAFKNIACAGAVRDDALAAAVETFVPRIHEYPLMMAGTGRLCSFLNGDPNIVAKGGANGVYGFALKKEKLGVAFKVTDGTESAWPLIALTVLSGLGALSAETEKNISTLNPDTILNDNRDNVGRREAAFQVKL